MKLLKLDEDKRKEAYGSVTPPPDVPESTGDLLSDIRKAAGSAVKASAMVNRRSHEYVGLHLAAQIFS